MSQILFNLNKYSQEIAKFGIVYNCTDLITLAETWLQQEFRKVTEQGIILKLTEIVLHLYKLGYKSIVHNSKIKEGLNTHAEVIGTSLTQSGVNDDLFLLHFVLNQEQTHKVPTLSDIIDTEQKYKTVLNKIDDLIELEPYLVGKNIEQLERLFEKGLDLISNRDLFKLHSKMEKRVEQLKRDVLSGAVLGNMTLEFTQIMIPNWDTLLVIIMYYY